MLENLYIWISWHLPKELAYWTFIRVVTTDCKGNPGESTCNEAAKRFMKFYNA